MLALDPLLHIALQIVRRRLIQVDRGNDRGEQHHDSYGPDDAVRLPNQEVSVTARARSNV
jgi:hypothetical protein